MEGEDLLTPVIDSIRPVKFQGTRIHEEFNQINSVLKDENPDHWENRERALKKIAGMAMQHEVDDEEFGKQLKGIRTSLALQVEDLRSTIVRTSAAMCVILNEELSNFGPIFEFLIPSFVKQLAVKAIPTKESAHQCIMRISIGSWNNDRILKQLLLYGTDKDKIIRTRLSSYVQQMCATWDKDALQRNLRDLLKYLNVAQGDGESLVRKSARTSICSLGDHFPAGIAQFYFATEDVKLKKELEKVLPEVVLEWIKSHPQASLSAPQSGSSGRLSLNQRNSVNAPPPLRNSYSGARPAMETRTSVSSNDGGRAYSRSVAPASQGPVYSSTARTASSSVGPQNTGSVSVKQPPHVASARAYAFSTSAVPAPSAKSTVDESRRLVPMSSGAHVDTSSASEPPVSPGSSIRKYNPPPSADSRNKMSATEKLNRAQLLANWDDVVPLGGDRPGNPPLTEDPSENDKDPEPIKKTSTSGSTSQRSVPSSQAGPTSRSGSGATSAAGGNTNDLLARLQALREQVQKLPQK